eukprot:PITA_26974
MIPLDEWLRILDKRYPQASVVWKETLELINIIEQVLAWHVGNGEKIRLGTTGKRLSSINVENVEANRRALRELLFTTPGALQYLSGVIFFEETLYQSTSSGKLFVQVLQEAGVVPGIKVDKGTIDLAVLKIGPSEPLELSIEQNAQGLARYAIICQENVLVPIVEPEILTDGSHDIHKCAAVTEKVVAAVYKALNDHHVLLEGTLLKPNMVTPGTDGPKVPPQQIAEHTVRAFQRTVPAAVPGIVFLSGGQSEEEATLHLNAINAWKTQKPWILSLSFGRALQQSTLKTWGGKAENLGAAQKAFLARCKANSEATLGKYARGAGAGIATENLHVKDYKY